MEGETEVENEETKDNISLTNAGDESGEHEGQEEAQEEEDYLNQIFEPVDPADLPTIEEVRRMKKEFDENSKSVENLIQIAKESKLEKNLLQTIHLKLPDRKTPSHQQQAGIRLTATSSKSSSSLIMTASEEDVPTPSIMRLPNSRIRQNCLYAKEMSYYYGISANQKTAADQQPGNSVSYFYRQLKKSQINMNEIAENDGNIETGSKNFIKQWRLLQKKESEAKLAEAAAAAAAKEISKAQISFLQGNDPKTKGAGDHRLNANGLEMRKIELASFTQNLSRKISRLQKDAAKLGEDKTQTFSHEEGF